MAGWIAGIALALAVGLSTGIAAGDARAREEIAADCRYSGGFALRRTGFICFPVKDARKGERQ